MKIIKKCRISEKTLNVICQYCDAEHEIAKEDVEVIVRRSAYNTVRFGEFVKNGTHGHLG